MNKSVTGFNWQLKNEAYVDIYEWLESEYQVYSKAAISLIEFVGIKAGMKILDLGCGTGIMTRELTYLNPGLLIGMDISKDMLRRAGEKLSGVSFQEGDFQKNWQLPEKMDLILASFAYYYFLPLEDRVFKHAYNALNRGGRFGFNVTSYLREISIGETKANTYFKEIWERLDLFLKDQGYIAGIGDNILTTVADSSTTIAKKLKQVGFRRVEFRFATLPLNPYQAYEFTLEGFYSKGSKPTFSSMLCMLPTETSTRLLGEFITLNKKYLESLPKVKILEVKVEK